MRNQFINLTSCVIIFLLTFQLVSSNISLAEEERVSDLISIQKLKNNNDGFISVYEDSNLNNLIESIKENDIQNIIKIHEYAIEIEILKTDLEITTGYIGVENFLDEEELNNYYYKVEELGWTISDFLIWINEKDNVDIEDIKEQDRENVNVKEDINEKIEKPEGEQLTINTKEKFDNEEERNEIANVALEEEIITEQSQVELHQDRSLSGASTYTNLLYGLALTNTNVYEFRDKESRVLRSYIIGHILEYRFFDQTWYEATVYLDGEPHTGYIHKDDVENVEEKQVELKGIGKKGPTNVYASATRNGRVLRGYNQGHILRYKTFSESWYEATVYLDGEPHTGYIHKDDVENSFSYQEDRSNYAMKNNTNVYSQASRSSTVLKSYQRGTLLKYRTFLPNWYEATVYINGKKHTGYIHVDDVGPDKILVKETYTNYNYKFNDLIDIQMTKTPKADGKGLIDANRQQVEYYANPLNFEKGTNEFYQFMVLSESAGVAANDINQRILLNAGILKNQGQTFINAGINYNINEIYLIAHAMHETGNGTSSLARGIVHKGRTVYNMYGIGAYDNCPNQCGAERAYNEGWFTPEAAILGGAQFISNGYVNAGQDTLYKMRWDPLNQGRRQYATHVAWATLQTGRIAAMYKLLDAYSISYDIPSFLNQPPVIVNKSLNIPLEGF